jgi:uncharacterized membrane protein YdfJ with MMPL/SSD domain
METSFFGHLRNFQSPMLSKVDSDEDTDVHANTNNNINHNDSSDNDNEMDLDDDDDDKTPAIVRSCNDWFDRFRLPILLAIMTIIWPTGYYSFFSFQKYTDSTFHPVAGSPSRAAADAFADRYTETNDFNDPMRPALMIVLNVNTAATNSSLIDSRLHFNKTSNTSTYLSPAYAAARNFSLYLSDVLAANCWDEEPCDDKKNDEAGNATLATATTAVVATAKNSTHHKNATTPVVLEHWLKVTSYYSLQQDHLAWLATNLATPDGLTTFVQVQYVMPGNVADRTRREKIKALLTTIQDYGDEYIASQQESYFTIEYTGIPFFQADLSVSTKKDLAHMDMFVLPLALLFMGLVLPRAHPGYAWIIPLVTMISTVSCWSLVMSQVCRAMQITHFTPTIMMSLSLGMGVDYTMFLLARYLEAIPVSTTTTTTDTATSRSNKRRAVAHMLTQGGPVLLLSGLTLMCTFLGLLFLPLQMLKSVGVGAAVSIGCALLVNLMVVPVLLYTRVGDWIVQKEKGVVTTATHNSTGQTTEDEDGDGDVPNPLVTPRNYAPISPPPPPPPPPSPPSSIWHKMCKHLLHPYRGIIILLVTCQLLYPVAQYCTDVKSSISFDLLLPSESPSLQTFHSLGDKVGWGRLNPYRILFDGKDANITMTSAQGFGIMHRVLDELIAIDHMEDDTNGSTHVGTSDEDAMAVTSQITEEMELYNAAWKNASQGIRSDDDDLLLSSKPKVTTYNGIAMLKNAGIPHKVFISAKYCGQLPNCPVEFLHVLDEIDSVVTSQDMFATFATATLATSPFSDEGIVWLTAARETVQRLQDGGALGGVQIHIQGSAAIEFDALQAVYASFPTMVLITTLVVFVLMGVFFRSVFTPLRSILSICLTLSFSFGLGVLVYQHGVFDWTGLRALTSVGDEVCWLVPIMTFSIIVGVALDYDVFLISRILEYRLEGYEHKTSIACGLHATGGIITAAGVIMAFAFGSLMFSSNPVLYQWSFLLTTAVLLDTFIIRTVVVPIITGLAGRHCWWPRQLPEETICMVEYEDRSEETYNLLRTLEESSEYEPLVGRTPGTP